MNKLIVSILCALFFLSIDDAICEEISLPYNSDDLRGQNYLTIANNFEALGFTKIVLEPIDDLIFGWLTKDGDIEKVSLSSADYFCIGDLVNSDDIVIIYYHTFSLKSRFDFELNDDYSSYTLTKYIASNDPTPETVVIPTTYNNLPVTKIGTQAFYSDESITSIFIPNGIKEISAIAFYQCDNLQTVTFPSSLRSIGDSCFFDCDALTNVAIPHSTSIGFQAFSDCDSLSSVSLGTDQGAFSYGKAAKIESYAFHNCQKLETASLGNYITIIEGNAFSYCPNLREVTMTNSIFRVKESAFSNCSNLELIYFYGSESDWLEIDFWPWWNYKTPKITVQYIQ